MALHADVVHSACSGGITIRDRERNHVLDDLRATTRDDVLTDAAELMHGGEATEHNVVLNDDMAREGSVVGKDDVIPHDAVMRDVGVSEEVVIASDDGLRADQGSTIHGAKLAEDVVVTHFEEGGFACIFEVLRLLTDAGVGVELVPFSDRGRAAKGDVVLQPAAVPQNHAFADDTVGTDDDIRADLSRRVNDSGRMDEGRQRFQCSGFSVQL